MLRLYKVPLAFLFVGSLLGVFLRWQFIAPTSGINYSFFLHGHSHIMFLGWIFNILFLAFVSNHIDERHHSFYKTLFLILQVLTLGMLVSFPLQGYGFWSILLSSLHTLAAIGFGIRFLQQTWQVRTISIWLVRAALVFFIISTAGPFSLGYLMANHLATSNWYNFSIYFYLHFQYNGFFFFGILSLFYYELEKMNVAFDRSQAKLMAWLFAVSCVPAYLLSTLWAKPGFAFNLIGSLAAMVQGAALVIFLKLLLENAIAIRREFNGITMVLFVFALSALTAKLLLQVASAFPLVAQLALELRPVVIAYLHLVVVGMVTSFLLAWYIHRGFLDRVKAARASAIFLLSFIGMELTLILSPWWSTFQKLFVLDQATYNFAFGAMLSSSFLLFLMASLPKKPDKSQLSI